ncbi:MAG: hypothetical protein PVI90_11615 [Desulfobacteraceae bacterium]|jgi:RNA-directed DNA polymerase
MPIKRHIKIKSNANPYDPEYAEYFQKRYNGKRLRNSWFDTPETAF